VILVRVLATSLALLGCSPSTSGHYNTLHTLVGIFAVGSIDSDIHDVAPVPYSKIFTRPSYYFSGRKLGNFKNFSHTQKPIKPFLLIVSHIRIKWKISHMFFDLSYLCDSFGFHKENVCV